MKVKSSPAVDCKPAQSADDDATLPGVAVGARVGDVDADVGAGAVAEGAVKTAVSVTKGGSVLTPVEEAQADSVSEAIHTS
jgi:hypothetical protein